MHWNLGRIYLHLKSNTKLTTLPTLCNTGKLESRKLGSGELTLT